MSSIRDGLIALQAACLFSAVALLYACIILRDIKVIKNANLLMPAAAPVSIGCHHICTDINSGPWFWVRPIMQTALFPIAEVDLLIYS